MHGPNRDREREGGTGQQQAPPGPGRFANLHRKAQTDIGTLDRHDDREQDKPRFVYDRHRLRSLGAREGCAMVGSRTIIDEVYAAAEAMSQACAKNLCEVVTRYDVIAVHRPNHPLRSDLGVESTANRNRGSARWPCATGNKEADVASCRGREDPDCLLPTLCALS